MDVPNHRFVVEGVLATGHYELVSHAGLAAFTDAAVLALNQHDPNWGHVKKKPGQTNIHGHGEDSALYKLPDGRAWAVDFVEGARGPNPKLRWGPDPEAYYTHGDWLDPADHDGATPPPSTTSFPYPDENTKGKAFQARVKRAYDDAHRPFPDPNDEDAFRHFIRYGFSAHEMPEPQAADKHIAELRAMLRVPPETP
jgi:hypothetical protein